MKILMINKFYYIKGGSETYLFGLKKKLEKNGHEVIPFSMKDKKNYNTKYEKYFIDNIDYNDKNIINKIKNATKIIYNFDANKKLRKLIKETKPDIAHLHIFQHQISPSILKVLREENIPIVYTVHDLKPVCLNYKMMNKKGICEKCIGKKYYNCVKQKCVKNSYLFSSINMLEGYIHNLLKSYDKIDAFITPSNFYREKLIEAGINAGKVTYIPNFVEIIKFKPNYTYEDYFIYVGRISEEKGIKTLLKAMKNVKTSKLKIIGTGPLKNDMERFAESENLDNVEFLGFKSGNELRDLIKNAKFIVIPSEWYENGPMSVIEAMAYGKGIIGSDIAGIKEMVKDDHNGYLFKVADDKMLSMVINRILNNEEKIIQFGKNSRKVVEGFYNDKYHYERIMSVYNYVLNNAKDNL